MGRSVIGRARRPSSCWQLRRDRVLGACERTEKYSVLIPPMRSTGKLICNSLRRTSPNSPRHLAEDPLWFLGGNSDVPRQMLRSLP